MIAVDEAKHVEGYKIWLRFSDGEEGIVDFSDIIERFAAAQPLKDPSEFLSFYLDGWPTLAWPCGFDYSPQALYSLATGKNAWDQAENEAEPASVE
ncbi:Protein of unknown function [Thiohalospira halophila DSM 15071]|uniref:DUF2442 domain-containing protein n=1 Tax=Thiohalospira halophila DSM 15071 TaxID=1123397 RepID=A0A1I1NE24_9GAMM|nr:DUF2442 domain-containing protein [Thiohalospira halophila]SFC95636.1 Protein of unknown function [Thiohalospira halophila DSM 15071]